MSIEEFVAAYHAGNPYYVDPGANQRLWVHDLLHAVLGLSSRSAAGEEAVSIYQAVLMRDDRVDSRLCRHQDRGVEINLECITDRVIPNLHRFLSDLGERRGFDLSGFLSRDEIADHFDRAQRLFYAFLDLTKDKRFFGDIPLAELKQIPVETYLKLAAKKDGQPVFFRPLRLTLTV